MRKWSACFLSSFLIVGMVSISGPFHILRLVAPEVRGEARLTPAQDLDKEGKKEETDSHYIQLLKQLKEKVDGWLKSLNERIEREDITRLEVRFLEILRNILEWVKEKIDSKIESEEKKPEKKERGLIQDTHHVVFPFLEKG
ncbi:MAG: hypothetical protein ABSB22_10885 [Thermodesulfobacteriota bacterium]|jgi:hypothetical protein